MNSGSLEIVSLIVSVVALIAAAVAIMFGMKLARWRKIFDPQHQPDNLEEVITSITGMLKKLNSDHASLSETVSQIELTLQTAYRYSSVVRFDSGSSDGGNLSFAAALLDGHQTGMIITSLHGREHNRIYCKSIKNGQSLQPLNEEEQQALIEALTGPPKPKTKAVKK